MPRNLARLKVTVDYSLSAWCGFLEVVNSEAAAIYGLKAAIVATKAIDHINHLYLVQHQAHALGAADCVTVEHTTHLDCRAAADLG